MLWYKKFKNGLPAIRELKSTNVKYETATTHLVMVQMGCEEINQNGQQLGMQIGFLIRTS